MNRIVFSPRWKEELVAVSDEGILIFELTMGHYHVYFPTLEQWMASVPTWAKPLWQIYLEQCSQWCRNNNIPLTLTDRALVYEERRS